jgi:hypothetical protein
MSLSKIAIATSLVAGASAVSINIPETYYVEVKVIYNLSLLLLAVLTLTLW